MNLPADEEILELHRRIVATRSVSGEEAAVADSVAAWLLERGVVCERVGGSLLAMTPNVRAGVPLVLFDTHLDTVPPGAGWTREPFAATVESSPEGDRVYGLGSNDAKASVAAMAAAFVAGSRADLPFGLALALVEGEETRGVGTTNVVAELARRGLVISAAVVGEPTQLDLAVAQKGLLVLELLAHGTACHAAHATTLGVTNAARALARDLVALEGIELGPAHSELGYVTLEPTVVRAGDARNAVPAVASAILDVRTTPAVDPAEMTNRVRALVTSVVRVTSERLQPRGTALDADIVRAALRARPEARCYGSATLSDWALLPTVPTLPTIKCGPGDSERSHRADEYVLQSEILAGARFYRDLLAAYAAEDVS